MSSDASSGEGAETAVDDGSVARSGQRTACPFCGGRDYRTVRSVHRRGGDYHVARSAECDFVFVLNPRDDTADHTDELKLGWEVRPRHHGTRRLIMSLCAPGARILEIGCGRGELGYLMRQDPYEYVGFEPARGLSRFGQRYGVGIVNELFNAATAPEGDAIVIDNVLEHVLDPRQLFGAAVSRLRPGGIVVVIVPNLDDVRRFLPGWSERHLWVPPDHINYFTIKHVRTLFDRFGLRSRPFGFKPMTWADKRYLPRAILETIGVTAFGINVFARKTPNHDQH